jgi:hypothetical protein
MRNWIVAAQSISQHIAIQPARVLRVVAENFEIEAALGAAVSMALAYNVLSSLIRPLTAHHDRGMTDLGSSDSSSSSSSVPTPRTVKRKIVPPAELGSAVI